MTKTCRKCGATKSREEFQVQRRAVDGLQSWCRVCMGAYVKARALVLGKHGRRKAAYTIRRELYEWMREEAMQKEMSIQKYVESVLEANQIAQARHGALTYDENELDEHGMTDMRLPHDAGMRIAGSKATASTPKEDAVAAKVERKWARRL